MDSSRLERNNVTREKRDEGASIRPQPTITVKKKKKKTHPDGTH